eukprot:scaffold1070_cov245-Pinguiococcus_pyrenoidosus.AAC.21
MTSKSCRYDQTRVHETRWDSHLGAAITRADRTYQPGDQIFENYGQPNKVGLFAKLQGVKSSEPDPGW